MDSLYPASKHVYKSGYDPGCSIGGKQEIAIPEQNIKVKINFIDTFCVNSILSYINDYEKQKKGYNI